MQKRRTTHFFLYFDAHKGLRSFSEPTVQVPDPAQHLVPMGSARMRSQFNPHARGLITELWISPWQREGSWPTCKFPPSKPPQATQQLNNLPAFLGEALHSPTCTSSLRQSWKGGREGASKPSSAPKLCSSHLTQSLGLSPCCHSFVCGRGRQTVGPNNRPNQVHHPFLQVKFYWNAATPAHQCVAHDCFML